MSAAPNANPFGKLTIAILIAVALAGAAGYLLLGAYGPGLTPPRAGGAHVLSNSAIGFSGALEMVKLTGRKADVIRNQADLGRDDFVILTPGMATTPKELKEMLDTRAGLPTLVVMPKHLVRKLKNNEAWVESLGELPPHMGEQLLHDVVDADLSEGGRGSLRTITGDTLEPLINGPDGDPILVQIEETGHYILADPDALNNYGLRSPEGIKRAMEIIDNLAVEGEKIRFDATLVGFRQSPNLLRLAFEAPFLPLTLVLLAAAALAVLHALRRFGQPAHEERKLAFGKTALAENGAALLRLARRRHRTGDRYAQLTRDLAASATGAPSGLTGEALDRYLDKLDREGEPFTQIAARATGARDTRGLLAAARDLYHWRRTVTRDHR